MKVAVGRELCKLIGYLESVLLHKNYALIDAALFHILFIFHNHFISRASHKHNELYQTFPPWTDP